MPYALAGTAQSTSALDDACDPTFDVLCLGNDPHQDCFCVLMVLGGCYPAYFCPLATPGKA